MDTWKNCFILETSWSERNRLWDETGLAESIVGLDDLAVIDDDDDEGGDGVESFVASKTSSCWRTPFVFSHRVENPSQMTDRISDAFSWKYKIDWNQWRSVA